VQEAMSAKGQKRTSGADGFNRYVAPSCVWKWFKTNTRIEDERLLLSLLWAIFLTNADVDMCSPFAISRKASQNSFSSDTLVLRPSNMTERLKMSVFTGLIPRKAT
jgi:hypothetical protein